MAKRKGWLISPRKSANDEFKVAAEKMLQIIIAQLKTLKTKKSDW